MQIKLDSRPINFQWNIDKYLQKVPIIDKIDQLIKDSNIFEIARYNTLLLDEFETMSKLIEMLNPELDYTQRVIMCNKAIIQKGDKRSVIEFLKVLGVTATIYNDPENNLHLIAELELNDVDLDDPGYFKDLVSKLIYELLFSDSSTTKIVSITLNFIINQESRIQSNLMMVNNITDVIYES